MSSTGNTAGNTAGPIVNLTVHPDGLAPGQVVSFIQGVMAVARAKADNPIVVNQALFGFRKGKSSFAARRRKKQEERAKAAASAGIAALKAKAEVLRAELKAIEADISLAEAADATEEEKAAKSEDCKAIDG